MMTRNNMRAIALATGAVAAVLMNVLVPLHVAVVHHDSTHHHHHDDIDECAICLHWQHQAIEPVVAWHVNPLLAVSTVESILCTSQQSPPLPPVLSRAPPA